MATVLKLLLNGFGLERRCHPSLGPGGGVFQLPSAMPFNTAVDDVSHLNPSSAPLSTSSTTRTMNATSSVSSFPSSVGGTTAALAPQQQQQQQQQQLLPLMSFGPPFVMPPNGGGNSIGGTAVGNTSSTSTSLAHLQQQQREAANHNNHSGHTHAIQLQTSLEMGPVVCPALCEIRTQLQELTRSVESCQSEVSRQLYS